MGDGSAGVPKTVLPACQALTVRLGTAVYQRRPRTDGVGLLEALAVFVVGYVTGTVTRVFASVAAVGALVLAVLGFALPESLPGVVDLVLGVDRGNELLFLAGFLFAIAHRSGEE